MREMGQSKDGWIGAMLAILLHFKLILYEIGIPMSN